MIIEKSLGRKNNKLISVLAVFITKINRCHVGDVPHPLHFHTDDTQLNNSKLIVSRMNLCLSLLSTTTTFCHTLTSTIVSPPLLFSLSFSAPFFHSLLSIFNSLLPILLRASVLPHLYLSRSINESLVRFTPFLIF